MNNSKKTTPFTHCELCPRLCGVDRTIGQLGFCGADADIYAARAALHFWEEPPISGTKGSGAVFFSHCTLSCVYCQNRTISRRKAKGLRISSYELANAFISLQEQGAHNINLVTATHYVPHIIDALKIARGMDLSIPIVYNSSGYENVKTLQMLDGYIDIYLPDFKYYSSWYSTQYSNAPDYREIALEAISEMVRQTGAPEYGKDGLLMRGTVVRHLMLPGLSCDTAQVLRDIAAHFGDNVLVSLMRQYTPFEMDNWQELNRKITQEEYSEACETFLSLGLSGFFQESGTVGESFIPTFDGTGLNKVGLCPNPPGALPRDPTAF